MLSADFVCVCVCVCVCERSPNSISGKTPYTCAGAIPSSSVRYSRQVQGALGTLPYARVSTIVCLIETILMAQVPRQQRHEMATHW